MNGGPKTNTIIEDGRRPNVNMYVVKYTKIYRYIKGKNKKTTFGFLS